MSQYVETNVKAFPASAAIAQYLRVKVNSSGQTVVAGAADFGLGTMEEASFAAGDVRGVRLRTASGTKKMVASGAITAGSTVYAAASGKISATSSAFVVGTALEAASANNDVIEVMEHESGLKIVSGQLTTATASDTVVTGLNTVIACVASVETDVDATTLAMATAQIGDQAGAPAAGSIIIKTWKATAAGTTTLIAATAFSKKVNWVAIGT